MADRWHKNSDTPSTSFRRRPFPLRSRHSAVQPEHHSKVDFDLWPVPRSTLCPSECPAPAPRRPHDMPPIFFGRAVEGLASFHAQSALD